MFLAWIMLNLHIFSTHLIICLFQPVIQALPMDPPILRPGSELRAASWRSSWATEACTQRLPGSSFWENVGISPDFMRLKWGFHGIWWDLMGFDGSMVNQEKCIFHSQRCGCSRIQWNDSRENNWKVGCLETYRNTCRGLRFPLKHPWAISGKPNLLPHSILDLVHRKPHALFWSGTIKNPRVPIYSLVISHSYWTLPIYSEFSHEKLADFP